MKKIINIIVISAILTTVSLTRNTFATETVDSSNNKLLVNSTTVDDNRFVEILANHNVKEKRFFDRLNLSNAQKQKWQDIQAKYRPKILLLRKQLRTERKRLRNLIQSDTSELQLRNQQENVWKLSEKMQNMRFDATLEMRQMLTSEQLKIWAESKEQAGLKANSRPRLVPR